jgi:DnaJ-domain-containing protein 1
LQLAENYYDILFISKKAGSSEIKAAYRKLVLKYHPDKNENNTEAEIKFRKIRIAYETLIHPERRKEYDNMLAGKSSRKQPREVIIKKAFRAIRIYPSSRIVAVGETFEVVAKSELQGQRFIISGLDLFHIVSGPEYAVQETESGKMLLLKYELKPKQIGYISIGPACITIDNVRFESDRIFIKVKEKGATVHRFSISRGENIFYIAVLSFFVFLFGLTFYNIKERGLMPDEFLIDEKLRNRKINADEIPLQLLTGASPYKKLNDKNFEQQASNNIVRIINGKYQDAVVFVVNKYDGAAIRNHYIRASDKYEIKNLPDGKYFLKVMFGNDWNYEKPLDTNGLKGGFNYNTRFELFSDSTQIISLHHQMKADTLQHSVYEITLFPVNDGNARSKKLNEREFFQ